MIGIYRIFNKQTNKSYIGQSIQIECRFKQHKKSLIKNIHPNQHLQYAWNRYGPAYFIFEVIEECDISKLNERETYWLNFYKPNTYNLGPNGNVNTMSE